MSMLATGELSQKAPSEAVSLKTRNEHSHELPDAKQASGLALTADPYLAHFRYVIEARYILIMIHITFNLPRPIMVIDINTFWRY